MTYFYVLSESFKKNNNFELIMEPGPELGLKGPRGRTEYGAFFINYFLCAGKKKTNQNVYISYLFIIYNFKNINKAEYVIL